MITDQNQRRAPDISWSRFPLSLAQQNDYMLPRPMSDLWIDIYYNQLGYRDQVFRKN